jgi:cobalt-zinc-cadmium efflux system outer membrane protein
MRVGPATAIALGLCAASAASAAPPAPQPISFAGARDAALRRAPEVLLSGQRAAVTEAQIGVAGALANPTISLQSGSLSPRLGAGISVPLPLFGQRGTAIGAAEADAEAARRERGAAEQEARWSATMAWLDLWEAQERVRWLDETAKETARLATIADQRYRAGSAPRVDVVRTGADRARVRAEALSAEAAVPAAAARLAVWLGYAEGLDLRAGGEPALALGEAVTLDALAQQLPAHPLLARDRAQIAAAAARVTAEQRQRWPVINAGIAVNKWDPTQPGTDVVGSLSFEPPLLSLRRGAIARARAEEAVAATTTDLEAQRLHSQLADAYRRARGAEARVRALEGEVLPALEEVRAMTEEGYRDGRIDLLRLLDAQRILLEGRLSLLDARAAWQRALADLERASGVRLDGGAGAQ